MGRFNINQTIYLDMKMRFSYILYAIAVSTNMALAQPIENWNDINPYQLTILADCITHCIAEGRNKLVVTQADPITGNKTSTTIQDFETAKDDKARKYRPVAVMVFEEISAQAKEIWFDLDLDDAHLHAACKLYMDQSPEQNKTGDTWELTDLKVRLEQGGAVQRKGPLGLSCVIPPS